ncbi:isomerase [Caulobacter sp. CCUG 60055]|uniref:PhzF family phenazine biosynthesis protein n=1 Tax=Caulobacter sp. CCUG 60055 TaxID=2100090 RepID=UPI001FA7C499|nr:PhzF family phenazine biosynthesis protein [Caulobacter sp. CCUG 60055]MCI3181932.1 isomerase [Caulobacter sp. CCUG 60055]
MRQWTVDAFASVPFKGNPACVVAPFAAWPDAAWMQALAAENNQAETAFLLTTDDPARFGLRWFTPAIEAPLCGHATLAAAHVLFAELGLAAGRVRFDTLGGALSVVRAGDGYEMDFPADPPRRIAEPEGLAAALGARPVEVWGAAYLVALVEDEAAVRALRPDLGALARIGEGAAEPGNVVVAAPARPGAAYDVVSRFFAPGSGIPEDPTTGSAHCILAPLFAGRLGRTTLRFHQAYPGRGGDLECEVRADRTLLRGRAVTVAETTLRLQPRA